MHLFLFTNSAQRELVSFQNVRRVYETAINFPYITALVAAMIFVDIFCEISRIFLAKSIFAKLYMVFAFFLKSFRSVETLCMSHQLVS